MQQNAHDTRTVLRRNIAFFCLALTLGSASPSELIAQNRTRPDTSAQFRTRTVPGGRIDVDHQVLRARYRMSSNPTQSSLSLRERLRDESASFGWSSGLQELKLVSDMREPRSRHVTFQQQYKGIPVDGRFVRVSMDSEDRPTMIFSGYTPIAEDGSFDPTPKISALDAERIVDDLFGNGAGRSTSPELVVVPGKLVRLAWRRIVWPADEPAEYVILLDAQTGDVISSRNQALSHKGISDGNMSWNDRADSPGVRRFTSQVESHASQRPVLNAPEVVSYEAESPNPFYTTGSGYVYIPDPITKAGVPYGSPYVDFNDATNSSLDAGRTLVSLLDISTDHSGQFILEGPHVKIISQNQAGTFTYDPPHLAGPNDFVFTRADIHFEAVNAYYHIDASQRYVKSLGIDRQNLPIGVNPHGLSSDDSFYYPNQNILVFGDGGVDDAEDASVLWHEYGHALLQAATPGLLSTTEGVAFHEGWSDYWAASYARELWETGAVVRADWERMFRWDSGDGQIWNGRVLDHTGHYPEDTCSDDPNPGPCTPHNDGRLWATVLMEIYTDIGKQVTDELALRSHMYLSAPVTLADAAEAVIQADVDYFAGAHADVLLNRFGSRGFVDVGAFFPTLSHSPIAWFEDLGGDVTISARAVGLSSPINGVTLRYSDLDNNEFSVALQNIAGDEFEAMLPIPTEPGVISYYLEVTDTENRTTLLPANAPDDRFQLNVGPDTVPPDLFHNPITDFPFSAWPPEFEVNAVDNLGMDRVTATYRIVDLFNAELVQGSIDLIGDGTLFSATLPVEQGILPSNVVVYYSLEGVDRSQSSNKTRIPSTGELEFTAESDGLIRSITFDTPTSTFSPSGSWSEGAPTYGLRLAHSGSNVMATVPDNSYPDTGGLSTLAMSRINLSNVDNALLTFWHWFDMEHDGTADPGSSGAQLWDGGNIKVSVDGGFNWSLLVPESGYNGVVAQSQANPLSGEEAFGGYSYGWRQVILPLPAASDVRVRFDFGTDDTNSDESRSFAGWYIDDVEITTLRPDDAEFPSAVSLPESYSILPTTQIRPEIQAVLTDDNGISDVFVDYVFDTRSTDQSGTVRMELHPSTSSRFVATFDFAESPAPSDRISYSIRVIDHSGHVSEFPGSSDEFEIDYWLIESQTVSNTAIASGIWIQDGEAWIIDGTTAIGSDGGETSSINLAPLDLPANGTRLELVMTHEYRLSRDFGGNVKISDDGGRTWLLVEPLLGYPDTLQLDVGHPMDDEPGFVDEANGVVTDRFTLDQWAGRQIRVRIDVAHERAASENEYWDVIQIDLESSTAEDAFEIPRSLDLYAAYPNPFRNTTRLGYTVDVPGTVELALFDTIGRRVQLVASGFHESGSYERTVSASNLAAGVYLARLTSRGQQRVQTIVLVR